MISIITPYNDETPLDFLATECEYEVTLYSLDDSTTSALCEMPNAGEKVRNIIDEERLLENESYTTCNFLVCDICINYFAQIINKIGL